MSLRRLSQAVTVQAQAHPSLAQALRWLCFLAGILTVAGLSVVRGWPAPIVSVDLNQHRLNQALPILDERVSVEQTFLARHDGLAEVEVQLARYEGAASGALTLQLFDERGQSLVTQQAEAGALTHNQLFTLRFAPQPHSAGRAYTLRLSGSAGNSFSVWGYTLDALGEGALTLTGAESAAQTLRLVTRYQLSPRIALQTLGEQLVEGGALIVLALAFLVAPGALLLQLASRLTRRWDWGVWWGVALALGAAAWPLLWYALTLVGGRWTGWGLWLTVTAFWILNFTFWIARRRHPLPSSAFNRLPTSHNPHPTSHIPLLLILLGGLAARLLAVRDLAFPPWVDSVRHALITEVMVRNGQTISSYAPLLPIPKFPYHFGFHTLPASLVLMTGWPLPETLLVLGQLLNALVPLAVYAAAWLLTGRRGVGLVAAFLVAFPFLFPGYYATWGRYTQLLGMVIVPVLAGLVWRLVRGGRQWRAAWWMVALLGAGLFLVHLRVFLYFLPFPLLVWAWTRGRRTGWLLLAGALGGALVAPRGWALWPRGGAGALASNIEGYNQFPIGYFTAGWERWFWGGAAVCVLVALGAWLLGRRWATVPLLLAAWVGALFGLLGGEYVGLPESWLVNLNSMIITLFFPLALVLAVVGEQAWRGAARWRRASVARYGVLGAALAALLAFGIRQQLTILNPQTLLAEQADAAGLAWLDATLRNEARVAVSAWLWLGGTWSGSDGGAWLLPLTGRGSSTPPADYIYNPDLAAQVQRFNEAASARADWADPAAAAWLREQGYTHVYVGARGGFFDPAALARNPALALLYQHEGVFIFEVRAPSAVP